MPDINGFHDDCRGTPPLGKVSKFAQPDLEPEDVLVNIKYAAKCDGRLQPFKEAKRGIVGGHVGVGNVVAIGAGVDDVEVGHSVGVQLINRTCGTCLECNGFDKSECCVDIHLSGHTVDGTLQEYCVCKASEAVMIPENMALDAVPPILCAGGTLERALRMLSIRKGDIVGIVGSLSKLGLMACEYVRASGFQVLVVLSEEEATNPLVKDLNADFIVQGSLSSEIMHDVQSIIPRGPSAVLACGNRARDLQSALEYIRPGGEIVFVGHSAEDMTQLDVPGLAQRAVSIRWAWTGSKSDTEKAVSNLENRQDNIMRHVKVAEILSETEDITPYDENHEWTVWAVPQSADSSVTLDSTLSGDVKFGRYLAYRMEELGIKDFFAVPGDSNMNLLDTLLDTKNFRFIGCCNELNAGYAADGYARTSSCKVAVVIVPYVVGGLSVINAICGAYTDKLKVVVISGCPDSRALASKTHLHHTPGPAGRDVALHAFQDVTAAAVRISNIETAASILDNALSECIRQSLPVYIEVANDVSQGLCPGPTARIADLGVDDQLNVDAGIVEAFKDTWHSASMPVVLIGPWAYRSCTPDIITSFVEKLGCPVLVQPEARGFPESHPQFCGSFWSKVFNPTGETVMTKADLWIVIGGRWSDLHTMGLSIDDQSHRLIDLQPDSIGMLDNPSEPLILNDFLTQVMSSSIVEKRWFSTTHQDDRIRKDYSGNKDKPSAHSPITLSKVVEGIQAIIQENDTMIADTGETWFVSQQVKLPHGATSQTQVIYASLGWALPAGLGCQIANTAGRAIVLVGDGAFQITGHEISTMMRQRLNPIVIVFNNLGYRTETVIQDGEYNYIANWDYSRLPSCYSSPPHSETSALPGPKTNTGQANASHVVALKIRTCGDLEQAVELVQLEEEKMFVIECCIHPDDITDSLRELGSRFQENAKLSQGSSSCETPIIPLKDTGKPKDQINHTKTNGIHHTKLDASRLKVTMTSQPHAMPTTRQDQGKMSTDHMVIARWTADVGWDAPELIPYRPLTLEPSANVLHYCTQCFEGMRVYRGYDNKLRLFRPSKNCGRMLNSARRVCLPHFEPDQLLALIEALCAVDAPRWLTTPGSSLYIRPTMIGTEATLGFKAPQEALLFIVLAEWPLPDNQHGLRLIGSSKDEVRAWPGGTGSFKLGANYAPSILAQTRVSAHQSSKNTSSQVLWLFGDDSRVTEAGTSNIFVIWKSLQGELQMVTPPVEGNMVLPGVMRQTVLDLAQQRLSRCSQGFKHQRTNGIAFNAAPDTSVYPLVIKEAHFTVHDIFAAAREDRILGVFTTGTAICVVPVVGIEFESQEISIPSADSPYISLLRNWVLDMVYGREETPWAHVITRGPSGE